MRRDQRLPGRVALFLAVSSTWRRSATLALSGGGPGPPICSIIRKITEGSVR